MHRGIQIACLLLGILCASQCTPAQAQNVDAVLAEADRLYDQSKWDAAIVKFDEALRLKPELYASLYLRGTCWLNKGDLDRALADFNASLRIMPAYAYALNGRGVVYMRKENFQAAIREYTEAIRVDPKLSAAYLNRGSLNFDLRNFDEAINDFSRMIDLDATNVVAWRMRAQAHLRKNDWNSAVKDYRQSLRLSSNYSPVYQKTIIEAVAANPNNASLYDALAWLYATSPEASVRNGKGAVLQAKAACEMTEYKNWAFLATLSAAYAEAGDFENAVTWAYGALDLAPQAEKPMLLERAKLFEKRQPYRDVFGADPYSEDGFVPLFDGKSLTGWKANERPECWKVVEGAIVANGGSSHMFYVGDERPFVNFELRLDFKTGTNCNGGVYFHTKFQQGYPKNGFEAQIDSKAGEQMTGSLYDVVPIYENLVADNVWHKMKIIVTGKNIVIWLNQRAVVNYVEPEGKQPDKDFTHKIDQGTFALQAHHPGSVVSLKNIRVKRLD